MSDSEFKTASFAEWRGIVKTAIDFIKGELERLRAEDLEQWEIVEQIRSTLEKHRDRCADVSFKKVERIEIDQLKTEIKTKAPVATVEALQSEVRRQDKAQIKQGVTLVFYGLIGGALFSILMALFNFIIKKV